jgi:hypothetical protein
MSRSFDQFLIVSLSVLGEITESVNPNVNFDGVNGEWPYGVILRDVFDFFLRVTNVVSQFLPRTHN